MAQTTLPSSQTNVNPRSHVGNLTWVVQAISGVLLVILAGMHFIAHHYVVEGGLRNFAEVQDYLSHPLIWPIELTFLVVVTAHAVLGIRAIVLDLGLRPAVQSWVDRALWVVGVLAVLYGFWLTYTIINF